MEISETVIWLPAPEFHDQAAALGLLTGGRLEYEQRVATARAAIEGDEKDHDLEALRRAMGSKTYCALSQEERRALIKASPKRDGRIRLAIDPRHVHFDDSLAQLGFISDLPGTGSKKTATPCSKAHSENMHQRQVGSRRWRRAHRRGR